MVGSIKKYVFLLLTALYVLFRASTTQSRFSIQGQKLGRPLIKKNDFNEVVRFQVSTAKWKIIRRRLRRRPKVEVGAVEAQNKAQFYCFPFGSGSPEQKTSWTSFFIKGQPNFWPKIENRFWVVLALNRKHPGPLIKKHVF